MPCKIKRRIHDNCLVCINAVFDVDVWLFDCEEEESTAAAEKKRLNIRLRGDVLFINTVTIAIWLRPQSIQTHVQEGERRRRRNVRRGNHFNNSHFVSCLSAQG
mmetsp:Transcript_8262/g.12061  ORF Transcript_8262/g.12061 Transcript_8262/m.12061 type:complete len:104 (-) Transcript_8262:192-503(-)